MFMGMPLLYTPSMPRCEGLIAVTALNCILLLLNNADFISATPNNRQLNSLHGAIKHFTAPQWRLNSSVRESIPVEEGYTEDVLNYGTIPPALPVKHLSVGQQNCSSAERQYLYFCTVKRVKQSVETQKRGDLDTKANRLRGASA